jgi:hypothetical protein
MTYEWLSPVMVGSGVVASYAALRQATLDLKESVEKLVNENRDDHRIMVKSLSMEIERRSDEDKDIREKHITWVQCLSCSNRKSRGEYNI